MKIRSLFVNQCGASAAAAFDMVPAPSVIHPLSMQGNFFRNGFPFLHAH